MSGGRGQGQARRPQLSERSESERASTWRSEPLTPTAADTLMAAGVDWFLIHPGCPTASAGLGRAQGVVVRLSKTAIVLLAATHHGYPDLVIENLLLSTQCHRFLTRSAIRRPLPPQSGH